MQVWVNCFKLSYCFNSTIDINIENCKENLDFKENQTIFKSALMFNSNSRTKMNNISFDLNL